MTLADDDGDKLKLLLVAVRRIRVPYYVVCCLPLQAGVLQRQQAERRAESRRCDLHFSHLPTYLLRPFKIIARMPLGCLLKSSLDKQATIPLLSSGTST